jgi:hypothetical protein
MHREHDREVERGTTISPHHVFLKPPSRSWSVEREHFGPFLALTAGRKPLLQRSRFRLLYSHNSKPQKLRIPIPRYHQSRRYFDGRLKPRVSTGSGHRRARCSSSQLLLTLVNALIYVCMHGRQPRRPRQSEGKLQQDAELFIL